MHAVTITAWAYCLLLATPLLAQQSTIPAIDRMMNSAIERTGATAGTISISKGGRLLYSKSYGWADLEKTTQTDPSHIFRIASNTKPLTAATIRKLIASRRLSANTQVFQLLEIAPYNQEVGDDRLATITVQHLLDHKGGWDKKASFDPMYQLDRISTTLELDREIEAKDIIQFMLAQPLQNTPGQTYAYSNFGYVVLGEVISKVTGKSYLESVQELICKPLRINDLRVTAFEHDDRDALEIEYPQQRDLKYHTRASAGGLSTSSQSLCRFLEAYWISGVPRKRGENYRYYHAGNMPACTTALMEQRTDGINYALMLNARRDKDFNSDNDQIRTSINRVIDSLKSR